MNNTLKNMALVAALALGIGANAQTENMYLIKGDRVVGKYNVDAVDYVSFKLPEGVQENNLWLSVDKVGKNNVTYTVNTIEATTTYAHGIVSYYDANYLALDSEGTFFEELDSEQQATILQACLPYVAFLGIGTDNYTMYDWMPDGNSHINVTPGTKYYLCAWEVDPVTQRPLDTFVYDEFTTEKPGASSAKLNVSFKRQNEQGLAFDISADSNILYITTAFGKKSTMEAYVEIYGADFLFGTFGQTFTVDFLQGMNDAYPDIEMATWSADSSGDYILMTRGYDANGDVVIANATATYEAPTPEGPQINILSKSKEEGKVSVTFEITPNKVSEAYVRLLKENTVDNKLNDGYYLYEIACGADAIDIETQINRDGEYTFTANGLDDQWYTILIYARDLDGVRTTLRINFNTLADATWDIRKPVHITPAKRALERMASKSRRPTIDRFN